MKALQVIQPRSYKLVQAPIPDLRSGGPGRILVQPHWVSMCGSDIPFFSGNKHFRSYPLALGAPLHECVGQVIESSSDSFKPGDTVVAIPDDDQGLAEFFVAQDAKTVKLPGNLDGKGSICLIQPLSTVMNAVDRLGNIAGKSVTVVGLGSIGLFFCWLLKQRGAQQIVGIDPFAQRCRMVEGLGANQTFPRCSHEVLHANRQEADEWEPPEICVEAVGHQMDTLNDCIKLVRKQGTVLAFGVPDHPVYAIEYETLFRKNMHLMAVVTPDWSEYLVKARDLFYANQAVLERLITHSFPIQDASKAFTLYEHHEDGILKALLDTSNW
jgi:threonine dehydrogenase-like Zn-dependent dehydrogenase